VASTPPIQDERIPDPGANMSTHLPWLEKMDGTSSNVVAPTVIALGADAGDLVHASVDSFPAATTTVIPAFVNRKIASLRAADAGPPILKFKTA
jgi:hypothetical protein